jgi:hypothetical protein
MNQFTKTTIVNSFDPKDFKKLLGINPEYVVEAYRHDGRWGRKEEVKVTIPTANLAKGDVVRMEIKLHTVGAHLGEFQNALTRNSELFTYEALYDGTSLANLVTALVSASKTHRNSSKNFDFEMKAAANGTDIELVAGADYIRFKEIDVNKVTINLTGYEAQEDLIEWATNKAGAGVTIVKAGMNGFGDTAWLINNFKLPTYVNTNWMALHQDERPVPGKLYNQFTLHAVADRGELTGMGAVGQKMASKTTHVFYVAADLSAAFEAEVIKCGNPAIGNVTVIGTATPNDGTATPADGTNPMTKYEVPVEVDTNADGIGEPSTDDILN